MDLASFSRKWGKVALLFLVFTALAGIGLRYYNFSMITGLNYKHLLHAHSHIALLGWMFFAFALALVREFFAADFALFKKIFLAVLISVVGMMLSFPFQGYAAISIIFSTLFLFSSYWFVIVFFKQLKLAHDNSLAAKWVRWALFFLVISSIGPWSLGPIMVFGESHGVLYNLAIYYYLHFLYNGFFVLATFAVMLKSLNNRGISYSKNRSIWFFKLTVYAVIPAYALSMLWITPPIWVYLLGGLAGGMQIVALIIAWPILIQYLQQVGIKFYKVFFCFVLAAYGLKELMQFLSAFPALATYAYETRVFTAIGYIHLVMLGFLSLFMLIYFVRANIFTDSFSARTGLVIFLLGIVSSELFLFSNGIRLWSAGSYFPNYSLYMMATSALMPVGLITFLVKQNAVKTVGS